MIIALATIGAASVAVGLLVAVSFLAPRIRAGATRMRVETAAPNEVALEQAVYRELYGKPSLDTVTRRSTIDGPAPGAARRGTPAGGR